MSLWSRFSFSKSDRKSLLAFCFFALCTGFVIDQYGKQPSKTEIDFTAFLEASNQYQLLIDQQKNESAVPLKYTQPRTGKVVNQTVLSQSKSIQTSKQSNDLGNEATPNNKTKVASEVQVEAKDFYVNKKPMEGNRYTRKKLDVNRSDVLDWEALPGIGPYYAKIITTYRTKLGGFASIDQVGETWRLPDSTFQFIRPMLKDSPILQPLDLNIVEEETLKKHPYINWREAQAIVNYRAQHGKINTENLNEILALDSTWHARVTPYLIWPDSEK